MSVRILVGDALSMLGKLESESVQACVTSPPYFGLRAYGTDPQVWGGDPSHDHAWDTVPSPGSRSSDTNPGPVAARARRILRNVGSSATDRR